jgi:hypothetical protein
MTGDREEVGYRQVIEKVVYRSRKLAANRVPADEPDRRYFQV